MHKNAVKIAVILAVLGTVAACSESRKVKAFPDSYGGVGLELKLATGGAEVVRVFPNGPAEFSGIKRGDIITSIDGKGLEGMTLEEVVEILRGPADSQVSTNIKRTGYQAGMTFVIKRGKLEKGRKEDYSTKR